MTPERWQKVEQLCNAALEREASQRGAFLAQACQGDDELRREVESLLAQEKPAEGFLESPALKVAASALATMPGGDGGPSLVGREMGCYQILSLLGAGGMGEVYEARDTKLGRNVAIKVLPAAFVNDPQRLSRFQREARMLAALNHPNIATIHGFEESDGVHYLVMELVTGQTLAERLQAGPLRVDETLKIAGQIAEALEAAHEKAMIHRDLKPANVKVTPEGRVKVLDFGLAKAFSGEGELHLSNTTLTPMRTQEGQLLGTPAYMSPEQVRGEELDARTDLFSFGVVLYEMATRKLPFPGNAPGEVFGAILHKAVTPPTRLNPKVPLKLEAIINKALEKDRKLRYQYAADIRVQLQRLDRELEAAPSKIPGDEIATVMEQQARVLEAAAPKQSVVGRSTQIITMIRRTESRGLREYLDEEKTTSITPEDVHQRPFELLFLMDKRGKPRPAKVTLRLDSPDFEPRAQTKKLRVPPLGDSEPCTFLVTPRVAGELVVNLELLRGDEIVVSRSIRTRAEPEGVPINAGKIIVTIPLVIRVEELDGVIQRYSQLIHQRQGVRAAEGTQPLLSGGVVSTNRIDTSIDLDLSATHPKDDPDKREGVRAAGGTQRLLSGGVVSTNRIETPIDLNLSATQPKDDPDKKREERKLIRRAREHERPFDSTPRTKVLGLAMAVIIIISVLWLVLWPAHKSALTNSQESISVTADKVQRATPERLSEAAPPEAPNASPGRAIEELDPQVARIDRAAIRQVIQNLSSALSRKDIPALEAIWPSLRSQDIWKELFGSAQPIGLVFHIKEVSIRSDGSSATVVGTYEGPITTGNRLFASSGNFQITLSKKNGNWLIDTVFAE